MLDAIVAAAADERPIDLGELEAAAPGLRRSDFRKLAETLVRERFLVAAEDRGTSSAREEIFYWEHGTTAAEVGASLAEVDVALFGVNHIGLALFGNLRSSGFRNVTFIDHPALRNPDFYDGGELRREISAALPTKPSPFTTLARPNSGRLFCTVACSDRGMALMRDWNRQAVANGHFFYPAVLHDGIAWLGPLVAPGEGPCYECLWLRRFSNLESPDRELAVELTGEPPVTGYLQPMARAAADFAAIDLLKCFSRSLPGGEVGRLVEVDLMAPASVVRPVLKLPRCPVCSVGPAAELPETTPVQQAGQQEPALVAK
jgi:bacteriocin biosynthesis cyclodehydratase domain-containing protein